MTVEVYLCEKFRQRHERKAFGRFLQEMLDRFRESTDLYLIIGEPEANTASMDMIVLTQHALIVVEMKELTYAEGVDASEVILRGKESGGWEYALEGGSTYNMGGVGKDKNPYQQIKDHRYKLRDWLISHSDKLPGGPWLRNDAIRKIYSWVVISPGYNSTKSELDLPWREIDRWFKILSLEQLAWEIETAVNPELDLSAEQMISIADQLGATRRENLREFVPNYVPPSPRLSFFGRPPVVKHLVDREAEKQTLLKSLEDAKVTVTSIGGPGGIGKTYMAAWLVSEAARRNYKYLWVECVEREVTRESFLAAVADKMPDKYQAALVHDPEQKITDKYDIVIEFLDQSPYLLVFNDYHRVPEDKSLDNFFTRVVQKAENVKILLTTRIRPYCLDIPEWAPGSFVEISLKGLPLEALPDYIQTTDLSQTQINGIWERTSGNPYAIGLMMSLLRNRRGTDQLVSLPLFDDTRAKTWAESLIETLPGEVRALVSKIAVTRSALSIELIERLAYVSRDKTLALINRAVDAYVLHEIRSGQYQMQDYIREALLSKANEKDIRKAHGTVGAYFENLANEEAEQSDKIELILQSLYHYENAENWQGVLNQARLIYQSLPKRGDRDRLYSVSKSAVRSAKGLNDKIQIVNWWISQIKLELEFKLLDAAKKNLTEAFNTIPSRKGKEAAAVIAQWNALEAQLWVLKGRLAYLKVEKDDIDICFDKGMALAEQAGDRVGLADTLVRVAQIERLRGNFEKAKLLFSNAGDLAYKLGDTRLLITCISHLGLVARGGGKLDEAKRLFTMAYEKAKQVDDLYAEQINHSLMGDAALRAQDYPTAEKIFRERLARARSIGNSLGIRISLGWLAEALIGIGNLAEAEQLLSECLQRSEEGQDDIGIAWVLKRKGQLEHARGSYEEGNALIQQGIEKLRTINNVIYIPDFEKALVSTPVPKHYTFRNPEGKHGVDG